MKILTSIAILLFCCGCGKQSQLDEVSKENMRLRSELEETKERVSELENKLANVVTSFKHLKVSLAKTNKF